MTHGFSNFSSRGVTHLTNDNRVNERGKAWQRASVPNSKISKLWKDRSRRWRSLIILLGPESLMTSLFFSPQDWPFVWELSGQNMVKYNVVITLLCHTLVHTCVPKGREWERIAIACFWIAGTNVFDSHDSCRDIVRKYPSKKRSKKATWSLVMPLALSALLGSQSLYFRLASFGFFASSPHALFWLSFNWSSCASF